MKEMKTGFAELSANELQKTDGGCFTPEFFNLFRRIIRGPGTPDVPNGGNGNGNGVVPDPPNGNGNGNIVPDPSRGGIFGFRGLDPIRGRLFGR